MGRLKEQDKGEKVHGGGAVCRNQRAGLREQPVAPASVFGFVSMMVCVCVCMRAYKVYVCVYACVYVYDSVCMCVCLFVHICVCI